MNRVWSSKRVWIIALAVIVVGLVGIYFAQPYKFVDFAVYYYAGISLLSGRTDLYAADFAMNNIHDYRYPPFFLIVFSPLSLLPHWLAAYLWYWLNVFAFGGIFCFVQKMSVAAQSAISPDENRKASRMAWILAFLIVFQYFLMSVRYGNVHTPVVFLLFGAFYLLMRRRDHWAAVLMSLAITIKIFPLIALPYFAVKKRWSFLALTVLLTIFFNLLPAFYFGFARNAEILGDWYQAVVVNQNEHEKNTIINLSLRGELNRYLTEIDYSTKYLGTEKFDQNYQQINFVTISEQTASRIWLVVSSLVFGLCLLLIWLNGRRGADGSEEENKNTLIEYSLIVCLMLFVGPLTSKIYFIELLLPVICLTGIVFNGVNRKDKFNRAVLIFAAVLGVIFPLLPGRDLQRLLLVLGTDFYMLCLLMIVPVNLLLKRLRSKKSAQLSF